MIAFPGYSLPLHIVYKLRTSKNRDHLGPFFNSLVKLVLIKNKKVKVFSLKISYDLTLKHPNTRLILPQQANLPEEKKIKLKKKSFEGHPNIIKRKRTHLFSTNSQTHPPEFFRLPVYQPIYNF